MPKMNVYQLLDTYDELDKIESLYHKRTKMPLSEFRILATVEDVPMRINTISNNRGVAAQGIGKTCERLESRGLVEIKVDKRDKRCKLVYITEDGARFVQKNSKVLEDLLA